ncbi:MAG: hypothetical protein QOC66_2460 [Pseudonocardiales bacterium]|nr:hypothetical protein [Pseudonocardiales bacterium]
MTTDLDGRLADLRLAPHWPAADRAIMLDQVLSTDPVPHRADLRLITCRTRRGRRTAVLATAGLAAAACIAVPAVLPAGSPGSADQAAAVQALHHLAHVAAVSPSDHLGPNRYLHLVDVEHQEALAGQPAGESRFEDWIRADGQTWQRRSERSGAAPVHEEVWLLPPGPQVIDGMTSPQFLDRLPTDPAALESYVRAHSVGSTSSDERVFVAVADIVRRGLAKPNLRSAAIEVLAQLGHVRLGDDTRDSLGNPVQTFEFVDPNGRPGDIQTVMFDTRTAQITEERDYFRGKLHFSRTVPVLEVVDTVPANIRERAIAQK